MRFNYIYKELRTYPLYSFLFILNVFFGLTGLVLVESFKSSFESKLQESSQSLAGGDLVLSSRMPILDMDLKKIIKIIQENNAQYSYGEQEEVFTMALNKTSKVSRLIQVVATDKNLPFYGSLQLEKKGEILGNKNSELFEGDKIWVYPEVLAQLNVSVLDYLELGGVLFQISDVVVSETSPQVGTGLAPRIFMGRNSLEKTNIIQKGSTLTYKKIFKITPQEKVNQIEASANKLNSNSSLRIKSHTNFSESNNQIFKYLTDYLGLISLIAILLSNMSIFYLTRAHLIERMKDLSILKILGFKAHKIFVLMMNQVTLLTVLGLTLCLCFTFAVFPVLNFFISKTLPFTLRLHFDFSTLGILLIVGVCGSVFAVFPVLSKFLHLSPKQLFGEKTETEIKLSFRDGVFWGPYFVYFVLLTLWQANSYQVSFLFALVILISILLLFGVGVVILRGLKRIRFKAFEMNLAIKNLSGRLMENLLAFVALSVSGLLISIVFTAEKSLINEFLVETSETRPSLFLFDIQEEQLPDLQILTQNLNIPLQYVSPLIRGRLELVNGKPLSDDAQKLFVTREDEQSERTRKRTYNLTERSVLSSAETVTKGRYFTKTFDPTVMPEISIEERFARRLNVKVGDHLTFDILGIPLESVIVGLRNVRWASFQPNFFIQFQEGVFKDTPKTYIASLNLKGDDDFKNKVQYGITEKFPNISVIDVTRTIEKILGLASQMAFALKCMAGLVFIVAILVVASIQVFHGSRNRREKEYLHYIGLTSSRSQLTNSLEAWWLTSMSLFSGWILSLLLIWPLMRYLFQKNPVPSFIPVAIISVFFVVFLYFFRQAKINLR